MKLFQPAPAASPPAAGRYPGALLPGDFVPELAPYDVILVNSSAGKDSQACLDYVVDLARAAHVEHRITVVHCDMGEMEWPGTAELAEEHARAYGLRFEKVRRPQGDLLAHVSQRGKWPGPATRYCTSAHKRGQARKVITALVSEVNARRLLPWQPSSLAKRLGLRPVRVLNVMGIRAHESPARGKKDPFRRDEATSNGLRTVDEWLPIHDWSDEEVWARVRRSGLRIHPAYALGMSRASCSLCVLASKKDLVTAARLRPDLARRYLAVEQDTGHDFRLDLPMREIVRLAEAGPDEEPPRDRTRDPRTPG